MKFVIRLTLFVSVVGFMSGCISRTPSIAINNGVQHRILAPCAHDVLCVRGDYDVTHDVWNQCGTKSYPVSYRPKQWEYQAGHNELIFQPKIINVD
jgi:hypothetical protein